MHTLQQLYSGELNGIKMLKISESLTSFPKEIFELSDTLEILDLSSNSLSQLPKDIYKLKNLKILFLSYNDFTSVPAELKECKNLYMLGIRGNKIERFDEDILPLSISWLILTENRLKTLPDSIGKLTKLRKCALAGNAIESLPQSMSQCKNLELLRLSANNLQEIPSWLLELPKLSWLAISGNPCVKTPKFPLNVVDYKDIDISKLLGEGASGKIFKGHYKKADRLVAVKFFKGALTSDGYAKDEMNAYLGIGKHENLIEVIAKIVGHEHLGLLLEYISSDFKNLGYPPDFTTCTRDTYDDVSFDIDTIENVAKQIASAAAHMHSKALMHGDLYAHNILINSQSKCYLGDFGAASFYDKNQLGYEKLEVRAYGCLLDDMLSRCNEIESQKYKQLSALKDRCLSEYIETRPLFKDMLI